MNYKGEILKNPGKYTVVRGPTVLYRNASIDDSIKLPIYQPYVIDDAKMLITLRDALIGDVRARDSAVYRRSYVRYGWIETNFNSLQFIPLRELVDGYYKNILTATEKRKLMEVCRLLYISIRNIPREESTKERKAKEVTRGKRALKVA